MTSKKAQVIESFKLTGRGFVTLLQHFENGLPKGTVLCATSQNNFWEVHSRLLHIGSSILFECETTEFAHLRFSTKEAIQTFEEKIIRYEQENTFWYVLKWNENQVKPIVGEFLEIRI